MPLNDIIVLDVILTGDASSKYEGNITRRLSFAAPKLKEDAVALAKLSAMTGWGFQMTLKPIGDGIDLLVAMDDPSETPEAA